MLTKTENRDFSSQIGLSFCKTDLFVHTRLPFEFQNDRKEQILKPKPIYKKRFAYAISAISAISLFSISEQSKKKQLP